MQAFFDAIDAKQPHQHNTHHSNLKATTKSVNIHAAQSTWKISAVAINPSRTLVVTTLDDSETYDSGTQLAGDDFVDLDTGDGSGLSLREAIGLANEFANLNGSATRIEFSSTHFSKDDIYRLIDSSDEARNVFLEIKASVIIDGDWDDDGIPDIIISGDSAGDDRDANGSRVDQGGTGITDLDQTTTAQHSDNSQIFIVTGGRNDLELDGVHLTGGVGDDNGGAVATGSGDVTITNSIFSGNRVSGSNADGGAVSVYGNLKIEGSIFTGNETSGTGSEGGAVFGGNKDKVVSVYDSRFSDNATVGLAAEGGALYSVGALLIERSTFFDNATGGYSADGGAVGTRASDKTDATIVNSTFVGNSTGGVQAKGGAIHVGGSLTLIHSTVTGNWTEGIGAESGGAFAEESIFLRNSIVLSNQTLDVGLSGNNLETGSGSTSYQGGNIVENTYSGSGSAWRTFNGIVYDFSVTADEVFANTEMVNALLAGAISDETDAVPTVALLADSQNGAIDGGRDDLAPGTDARGETRPVDLADTREGDSDIGAFELQPSDVSGAEIVVNSTADTTTFDFFDSDVTLREAVALANLDGTPSRIVFDNTVFTGGSASLIRLTEGELSVTDNLVIDGADAVGLVITGDASDDDIPVAAGSEITDVAASFGGTVGDADDLLDDNSRIFNVSSGDLTVGAATLTGGRTSGSGGAISSGSGDVTITDGAVLAGNSVSSAGSEGGAIFGVNVVIEDSTIYGNVTTARFNGLGGGVSATGTIGVYGSTIRDNDATFQGGGLIADGAITVEKSTISGNSTTSSIAGFGGGLQSFNDVTVTNSTIADNSTLAEGGGLYGINVVLTNSTITGNSASILYGGGVSGKTVEVNNSIVLGNFAGLEDDEIRVRPNFTNPVNNNSIIAGDDVLAASIFAQTTDNNGVTAGVLADNGGPVETVALRENITNP